MLLPAADVRRSPDDIPYLAPEIQLLYKARGVRAKDQVDFDRVAPRQDLQARSWLRDSIESIDATHRWLAALVEPAP